MCPTILPAPKDCTKFLQWPWRPEGGIRCPGVRDDYEPPCGVWGPKLVPPEEQHVLLTTEPSLQPRINCI